jgi:hypothetical protein
MHLVPVHGRLPRARIDPITDADTAFITISMAVHRPLRHEIVVALLDDARRGLGVLVVNGTKRPDAVIEVVECLLDPAAHGGQVGAIIVASVRPTAAAERCDAPEGGDIDRWLEMSDFAEQAGIELLEWFVIADEVSCPRDLLGEPPRW